MRGRLSVHTKRGVNVRLVYTSTRSTSARRVPPPPKTEPPLIESLPFSTAPVQAGRILMHHKYVVRDRDAVWAGSTNWTDDSWTREENVIVIVVDRSSDPLQDDFAQLWKKRKVSASGRWQRDPIQVGDAMVRTWFSPKGLEKMAHRIADAIGGAERRVRVASPVITSALILGRSRRWPPTARSTWRESSTHPDPRSARTVAAERQRHLEGLRRSGFSWSGDLPGKRSTPYAPGSVHDYMHAKVTVADNTVFIGSFNLSHSGETNAENVLGIEDAALAERMAGSSTPIRAKYPALTLNSSRVGSAAASAAARRVAQMLVVRRERRRSPSVSSGSSTVNPGRSWRSRRARRWARGSRRT